jgi:predicted transposase/invertase (TIGR01784 family)
MPITRFLDPKNDMAFKRIFGTEKNKDLVIHFLNEVLPGEGENRIKEVIFLDETQYLDHRDIVENLDSIIAKCKLNTVDVLCTDEKGKKYIVELEVETADEFIKKAQYDEAQVYTSQLQTGQPYEELKAAIFLALVDGVIFPKKNDYKSEHLVLDKKTLENDLKDSSYIFVELGKFSKSIGELRTHEDRWLYLFKHSDEPENMQKLMQSSDQVIKKACDELSVSNWTREALQSYDSMEKVRLLAPERKAYLEYVRNESRQKGI